jgi:hypothetical protein
MANNGIAFTGGEGFLFDVQWKAGTRSNDCNGFAMEAIPVK